MTTIYEEQMKKVKVHMGYSCDTCNKKEKHNLIEVMFRTDVYSEYEFKHFCCLKCMLAFLENYKPLGEIEEEIQISIPEYYLPGIIRALQSKIIPD